MCLPAWTSCTVHTNNCPRSTCTSYYVVSVIFITDTKLFNLYFNIYPTRCNFTEFIYIQKLLYMFRVVPPPTIRSTYYCIYSIWYLSHRYCYLPLLWKSWNSNFSTIAAGSSNGVTNTRCCKYSCMCS
jgi:hypothetical protein